MDTEDRRRTDAAMEALGAAMARNEPEWSVLASFKALERSVPETSGVFFELDLEGRVLMSHFELSGSSPEAQAARKRLAQAAESAGLQDAVRFSGWGCHEICYLQVLPRASHAGLRALQDMIFELDGAPCPEAEQDDAPSPGM